MRIPYVVQLGECVAQPMMIAGQEIPSGVRGKNTRGVRDQGTLSRTHLTYQIEELRARITLDIELDSEHLREIEHIAACDVPAIGPRMNGNPVAACGYHRTHCLQYVGHISAAGISEYRDFVDVDAEVDHR